jgi:4-diphosphocytidyl-2-C-methyl-D-erythritol kinase
MVTIDLFDEVEVVRLAEGSFSRYAILWHADAKRCTDIDWSVSRDLAVRAHRALESHVGRPLPVQMKLEKRIPVGGGLGGGSSDAAAMLHAVNNLFDLGMNAHELASIGGELGSDVPFLIHGGSAIVESLGDQIEVLDKVPELHAVIAFPDAICPTGEVYDSYDELGSRPFRADAIRGLPLQAPLGARSERLFNDLGPAAAVVAPELDEALRRLEALAERQAHVSGSGSSIFVVCDDPLHAEALAAAVEAQLDLPAVAVKIHVPTPATA